MSKYSVQNNVHTVHVFWPLALSGGHWHCPFGAARLILLGLDSINQYLSLCYGLSAVVRGYWHLASSWCVMEWNKIWLWCLTQGIMASSRGAGGGKHDDGSNHRQTTVHWTLNLYSQTPLKTIIAWNDLEDWRIYTLELYSDSARAY